MTDHDELALVHDVTCSDGCGTILGTVTNIRLEHLTKLRTKHRCFDCHAALGPAEAAHVAAQLEAVARHRAKLQAPPEIELLTVPPT